MQNYEDEPLDCWSRFALLLVDKTPVGQLVLGLFSLMQVKYAEPMFAKEGGQPLECWKRFTLLLTGKTLGEQPPSSSSSLT